MSDWSENLKPGDEVLVKGNGHPTLEKVERITPTQIILPHNRRFSRHSGWLIGRVTWGRVWLAPVTDEERKAARKVELVARFKFKDWNELDLSVLEEIAARLS